MQQASAAPEMNKKSRKQYTLDQKRWVVRRRLELQEKFNNKMHKNEQQWDDLTAEYRAAFPDDACREKGSLRDAVWDKEFRTFKEWCKTRANFRAGMTSGLGRDEQDSLLLAKQGIAHDIFIAFKVDERPIAQPSTLINAGNAMAVAATVMESISMESLSEVDSPVKSDSGSASESGSSPDVRQEDAKGPDAAPVASVAPL